MLTVTKIMLLACGGMAAAMGMLGWERHEFYQMTGSWTPIRIIETLDSPVDVDGWTEDGLELADGRVVQLPGFAALPLESETLAAVTSRGVEVAADGTVTGLRRHWRKCGNDPVTERVTRVDIGQMLRDKGEGVLIVYREELALGGPVE